MNTLVENSKNPLVPSLLDQAKNALDSNQYLKAEYLLNQISDKDYPKSLSLLSTIAFQNGYYKKASDFLLKAISLDIENQTEYYLGLSTIYKQQGKSTQAISVLKSLSTKNPNEPQIQFAYGNALMQEDSYKLALRVFKKLKKHYPKDVSILFALATCNKETGELKESVSILLEIIVLDPGYFTAYTNLMGITSYKKSMFDMSIPISLTHSIAIPKTSIAILENAIGKMYENIEEFDSAFKFYESSNNKIIDSLSVTIDFEQINLSAKRVKSVYTKEFVSKFNSDVSCPLIFIFGMPRSGSTLLEQILLTDPDIETLGETTNMVEELFELQSRIKKDPNGDTFPEDYRDLSDNYLKKRVGKLKSKFCIDKMPGNFRYIGLMYLLFPNAKFIYTKRNPIDTCFSGWTTLYQQGHYYSYTFDNIIKEYRSHEEIVNHWLSVLPENTIHTVSYESVINNFESSLTGLCSYLGISYSDKMKNFHKNKRRVKTASVGQVTKPLYRTSVNRSGNFRKNIEQLLLEFQDDK